jgi:hypothetical protein
MRCWLLPAGSSLESMTELGVTPLALWGSAQVLMVLTSSSMVMERRANICSTKIAAQQRQSPCSGAQPSLPAPTGLPSSYWACQLRQPLLHISPARQPFWYVFWAERPSTRTTLLPPAASRQPPASGLQPLQPPPHSRFLPWQRSTIGARAPSPSHLPVG